MDVYTIEELAAEALNQIKENRLQNAILTLAQLQGICKVAISEELKWDMIREGYEQGMKPKQLSQKYKVLPRTICNRAYYESWPNPNKIRKQLDKEPKAKNIFYLNCHICENEFEAYSGHAKICNQCKALDPKRRKRYERKPI